MESVDITIEDGGAHTTLHFDSAEEARAALASRGIDCSDAVFEGGMCAAAAHKPEPEREPSFVPVVCCHSTDGVNLEFVVAASEPLQGKLVATWLADVVVKFVGDSEENWWNFVWSADGHVIRVAAWVTRQTTISVSGFASAVREAPLAEGLRQVNLVVVSAVSQTLHDALVADATTSEDPDTRKLSRRVGWLTRRIGLRRCPIWADDGDQRPAFAFLIRMATPDILQAHLCEAAKDWVRKTFQRFTAGKGGSWCFDVRALNRSDTTINGCAVRAIYDCGGGSTTNHDGNPLCVVLKQVRPPGLTTAAMTTALRNAEFPDALAVVRAMGVSAIALF
jgi:hypothetical protein